MLVENQQIIIKWNYRNKKYYEGLGYEFTNYGDEIIVSPQELSIGSQTKVKVICDYCNKETEKQYCDYITQHRRYSKDCCGNGNCQALKRKDICLEKYGVENVMQVDSIKETLRNNNIAKFGVTCNLSLPECKEKIRATNIKKYGTPCSFQNDEVKKKAKDTMLNKYGVDNVMKLQEFRDRARATCLDKYGVENALQLDWVKELNEKAMIDKYGVKRYMLTDDFKEKSQNTCVYKYGVPIASSNKDVYNKRNQTCIDRYGTENVMSLDWVQEKIRQSFYKNNTCPTSSQQLKLFDMLKDLYGNCELNYPCGPCSLDCMLIVDSIKLDIEYDGEYWHQDKDKDRRRDEYIKSQGYKVLRIKGSRTLPTKEELIKTIDCLVESNHSYAEIKLNV